MEAAPWDLVIQTRKGNVTGATSGASSGPPTLPPLLCCRCCCAAAAVLAAVVVLRSSCVSALCKEVGNVHVKHFFNMTDLTTFFLPSISVGFCNADEKGQRCWWYERCFFWPAHVTASAVLLAAAVLLFLRYAHHVCLCFVFPSCAVSPWSWELCMPPPTKICSSIAVWSHL